MIKTLRLATVLTALYVSAMFESRAAASGLALLQDNSRYGLTPIDVVSPANYRSMLLDSARSSAAIKAFCSSIQQYYRNMGGKTTHVAALPGVQSFVQKMGILSYMQNLAMDQTRLSS